MHRSPTRGRRPAGLSVLLAAGLVLTACGGSDDAGSGGSADGTTALSVGYFPLVHTASVVNADEHDLFAAEGLDVTLATTSGGAQAIPAIRPGQRA